MAEAAQTVLNAGFKDVVLCPLDVTHQLSLPDLRQRLRDPGAGGGGGGELADFLCDISHFCAQPLPPTPLPHTQRDKHEHENMRARAHTHTE
jgi:inosine-uridine nucleoside N-ribohydrolase